MIRPESFQDLLLDKVCYEFLKTYPLKFKFMLNMTQTMLIQGDYFLNYILYPEVSDKTNNCRLALEKWRT